MKDTSYPLCRFPTRDEHLEAMLMTLAHRSLMTLTIIFQSLYIFLAWS